MHGLCRHQYPAVAGTAITCLAALLDFFPKISSSPLLATATCCPCVQIDKCFGFDTAVEEAQRALLAAKVEAVSGYRGLGIVKLMGRSSGFIAMQASMASGELLLLLLAGVVAALSASQGGAGCHLFCSACQMSWGATLLWDLL